MTRAQAFNILDTQRVGIPWEAIDFLYNHPPHPEIAEKIRYALQHAYDNTYWDEKTQFMYPTPLWYAIVAENHLSESLMQSVIDLYTQWEEDWDFLNEQGNYLVGALAEKFGDEFAAKVLDAIEISMLDKKRVPALYLHDSFYFGDFQQHKKRIYRLLHHPDYQWKIGLIMLLGDLVAHKEDSIPEIEKFIQTPPGKEVTPQEQEQLLAEAKYSLAILRGEDGMKPHLPHYRERFAWKEHYKSFEQQFGVEKGASFVDTFGPLGEEKIHSVVSEVAPKGKTTKIGRNDPCPCGSGSKYKKCCLKKGI